MCFAASPSGAFRISMEPKFFTKMLNIKQVRENVFKVPALFDILI